MTRYKRILVVVDPSAEVHPSVKKAAALASASDARLDLVICDYDDHLAGTRFGDSEQLRDARATMMTAACQHLEQLAEPLRADGIDVEVHTVFDHPLHDGIIRMAEELQPDILVKDTHYHHFLKRAVFSNTDWELIRNAPFDLLLTKSGKWSETPVVVAAVDPLHIGDKPATLDRAILDQALRLTDTLKGSMRVVHCFPVMTPAAIAGSGITMPAVVDNESLHESIEKSHRLALDNLVSDYKISPDAIFLIPGEPRHRLDDMARALGADIMVVGAVSRSRIKETFLGFTALHILDRLQCDLLIEKISS